MGHVDGCATAWAETSAGQETASSPSNSYWDSDGFRGCGCSHPWACLHIEASFLICGVHVSSHDVCYGHIFMRPNHETVSAHHFLCIAEPTWHHVLAMTFSHGSFVPVHGCCHARFDYTMTGASSSHGSWGHVGRNRLDHVECHPASSKVFHKRCRNWWQSTWRKLKQAGLGTREVAPAWTMSTTFQLL